MTQDAKGGDPRRARRRSLPKNSHKKQSTGSLSEHQDTEKKSSGRDMEISQACSGNDPAANVWEKHRKKMEKAYEDMKKLFCKEFMLLGGEQVREEWKGIGKRSLESLCKKNQVLGLSVNGEMRYPAFQFDEDGKPFSRMQEVLEAIPKDETDWQRAFWLVTPNECLGWKTPISAIKSGDADVVTVAKHAGELPVG